LLQADLFQEGLYLLGVIEGVDQNDSFPGGLIPDFYVVVSKSVQGDGVSTGMAAS
jgi:hypothetical protein